MFFINCKFDSICIFLFGILGWRRVGGFCEEVLVRKWEMWRYICGFLFFLGLVFCMFCLIEIIGGCLCCLVGKRGILLRFVGFY